MKSKIYLYINHYIFIHNSWSRLQVVNNELRSYFYAFLSFLLLFYNRPLEDTIVSILSFYENLRNLIFKNVMLNNIFFYQRVSIKNIAILIKLNNNEKSNVTLFCNVSFRITFIYYKNNLFLRKFDIIITIDLI